MDTNLDNVPTTASAVRHETKRHPIEVSRVYKGDYQKEGELQAELKQTVETTSYYPAKTVTTDLQDNPFKQEEFKYEEKVFPQKRTDVAWIPVPGGTTAKEVLERITINPNSTLYRILSNYPVFNSNQLGYADSIMSDENKSKEEKDAEVKAMKDKIADSQVLRYGSDDSRTGAKKGDLILDTNGKPQYKVSFYSENGKQDVDKRIADFDSYYATAKIEQELKGINNSVLNTERL